VSVEDGVVKLGEVEEEQCGVEDALLRSVEAVMDTAEGN
jgi:hypothetical protein